MTENLLYRGPDGKLVPWLAESWTRRADGRSVTFKLRRDVKFHDGTPFNAEAVKFNFDRIVDPKFKAGGAARRAGGLRGLEGARRVHRAGELRDAVRAVPELARRRARCRIVSPKAVRESGDQVHTRPSAPGRS